MGPAEQGVQADDALAANRRHFHAVAFIDLGEPADHSRNGKVDMANGAPRSVENLFKVQRSRFEIGRNSCYFIRRQSLQDAIFDRADIASAAVHTSLASYGRIQEWMG